MVAVIGPHLSKYLRGLAFAGLLAVYLWPTSILVRAPRVIARDELSVSLSPPLQLMLAFGDRYLAAELSSARLLVLNVLELPKDQYALLAEGHENVSFLNPCQEDNYYTAQSFLPWVGYVSAVDRILANAQRCRVWEFMPSFYRGFNAYHFDGDYKRAGDLFIQASNYAQGMQKLQMQAMAARFYDKQADPKVAIKVLENLRDNTNHAQLRAFLNSRISRLEVLLVLRDLVVKFQVVHGRLPVDLNELVSAKLLTSIPVDPFGKGFFLNENGQVEIKK